MGCDATKPVFGVSHKARLKPVSSATIVNSKNSEILLVASFDMILSKKANNKDADQTALMQTPRRQVFSR